MIFPKTYNIYILYVYFAFSVTPERGLRADGQASRREGRLRGQGGVAASHEGQRQSLPEGRRRSLRAQVSIYNYVTLASIFSLVSWLLRSECDLRSCASVTLQCSRSSDARCSTDNLISRSGPGDRFWKVCSPKKTSIVFTCAERICVVRHAS